MTTTQPAEAVHLCSVPATSLPRLAEHRPVVDFDVYEFGRRQVGHLVEATHNQAAGTVSGVIELTVARRDPNRPGHVQQAKARNGFQITERRSVTAHLRTSVLGATVGAIDLEHAGA